MQATQFEPFVIQKATAPTPKEFLKLSQFLKNLTGIHLPPSEKNIALMSGRLQKLRAQGVPDYDFLIRALERQDRSMTSRFVCAMTTNTTHFFREDQHFGILEKIILQKIEEGRGEGAEEFRIWCAASSSGEEPYSLAMTLMELQQKKPFSFKMLATDIDAVALATAKAGAYSLKQTDGIPAAYLLRYFQKATLPAGEPGYQVNAKLQAAVQFGRLNLMKNYPFKGRFDIIFCRNVLIYFDKDTVSNVIHKMTRVMRPEAHLFLGHSEAIAGMQPGFQRAGPAVYRWRP